MDAHVDAGPFPFAERFEVGKPIDSGIGTDHLLVRTEQLFAARKPMPAPGRWNDTDGIVADAGPACEQPTEGGAGVTPCSQVPVDGRAKPSVLIGQAVTDLEVPMQQTPLRLA